MSHSCSSSHSVDMVGHTCGMRKAVPYEEGERLGACGRGVERRRGCLQQRHRRCLGLQVSKVDAEARALARLKTMASLCCAHAMPCPCRVMPQLIRCHAMPCARLESGEAEGRRLDELAPRRTPKSSWAT